MSTVLEEKLGSRETQTLPGLGDSHHETTCGDILLTQQTGVVSLVRVSVRAGQVSLMSPVEARRKATGTSGFWAAAQ